LAPAASNATESMLTINNIEENHFQESSTDNSIYWKGLRITNGIGMII
jgi:hypothetical protein